MLIVYIFLGLAGAVLLFISFKGKNKRMSNLVNFLLTTVATLIGVIMAINVSVDNEMKKEKEDLVKILESGIYVIDKVTKYVENTSKEKKVTEDKLNYKEKETAPFQVTQTIKSDSLMTINTSKKQVFLSTNKTTTLDSLKKKIDSVDTFFLKKIIKPSEFENFASTTSTISVLSLNIKLPFPDYIGSLLTNPDFLKGLSKKSLLILNEDYINLQRTYQFNTNETLRKDNNDIIFYTLALKKIKRTLQLETAYQEKRITKEQLNEYFEIVRSVQSSELIYKILKNSTNANEDHVRIKE